MKMSNQSSERGRLSAFFKNNIELGRVNNPATLALGAGLFVTGMATVAGADQGSVQLLGALVTGLGISMTERSIDY